MYVCSDFQVLNVINQSYYITHKQITQNYTCNDNA